MKAERVLKHCDRFLGIGRRYERQFLSLSVSTIHAELQAARRTDLYDAMLGGSCRTSPPIGSDYELRSIDFPKPFLLDNAW